jgi:hypothetical protein
MPRRSAAPSRMPSFYPGFLKRLIIFSVMTALAAGIVMHFLPETAVTPAWPYLFLFFMVITAIIFYVMIRLTNKRPALFISGIMVITTVKILLFAVIIILYIVRYPTDKMPFVITFLILYLFYTVFEVMTLNFYIRKDIPGKKSTT